MCFIIHSLMYWSEWGHSNRIRRAAMDGSDPITLIINAPSALGLTLDFEKKRLYWAEKSSNPGIFSSDFNGLDKKNLVKEYISRPIGLTLYKDHLYWSDESKGEIIMMDKKTGNNRTVIGTLSKVATDLLMIQKKKERSFNQCAVNNGDCSHLCLAVPSQSQGEPVTFKCACPTHYILQNNTCVRELYIYIYIFFQDTLHFNIFDYDFVSYFICSSKNVHDI